MREAYYVEIAHRYGTWLDELILRDKGLFWFGPDVPHETEDEAFAAIGEHFAAATRAYAAIRAEKRAKGEVAMRLQPIGRWRIVRSRRTPWARSGHHETITVEGRELPPPSAEGGQPDMSVSFLIEIEHVTGSWLQRLTRRRVEWKGGFGAYPTGNEAYDQINEQLAEAREQAKAADGVAVTGNWRIIRRVVSVPEAPLGNVRASRYTMLQGKGPVE